MEKSVKIMNMHIGNQNFVAELVYLACKFDEKIYLQHGGKKVNEKGHLMLFANFLSMGGANDGRIGGVCL